MDGSVNFHRNWMENKNGFGNLDGEFFIGLDKIHALTTDRRHELLVLLEDNDGIEAFETYDDFKIGNEDTQYILDTVGTAKGTAGDSLIFHRGMKFTTLDNDNDDWPGVNCALANTGGWWYKNCQHSQLMGRYEDKDGDKGVLWASWRGWRYSLKKAIMMIRPKN
ncbi:hypothetical protein ACLKA7_002587 [Drosophila subpalustris]